MKKQTILRIFAMALCVVMVFLAGCAAAPAKTSDEASGEVKYKDTIVINGGPTNLVSFDFEDGSQARSLQLTHDRLVEKNLADGKPRDMLPGLATEWQWIDDTTLEMKLREGVKFHNGEIFTADDVAFTFNDCLLTHSQATKISMLDHVEKVDDYTVHFILKQYHADFLYMLSEEICSIVNRKAVEENEIEGAYIGTGPYYLTEFVQSDYCDYERFDDYWGEKAITKHIHMRGFPEVSTGVIALENGETDVATFDVVDMQYLEENPDIVPMIVPNAIVYLAFNTSKGAGADENLRLAIAYCMNQDDYLAVIDPGYSTPTATMWSPNTFGYDDSVKPYGLDLEKAKEYLEKSEYKEITVTTKNSISYIAEVLQANCAKIGLKVNIELVDSAAFSAMTKFDTAEHEACISTLGMNLHGDDCRRPFYPKSNVNKAILTDDEIISRIDAAATSKDDAEREQMYHEIQQIIHEHCYYLPLCLGCETTAFNAHLEGIQFETRGRHDYAHAYIIEQ